VSNATSFLATTFPATNHHTNSSQCLVSLRLPPKAPMQLQPVNRSSKRIKLYPPTKQKTKQKTPTKNKTHNLELEKNETHTLLLHLPAAKLWIPGHISYATAG